MANGNDSYPVRAQFDYPPQSNRLLALSGILCLYPKILLAIPHLIVMAVLILAAQVAAFFCVFAVLLNGTYPRAVFDFVGGALRWQLRVNAWIFGLVDQYPPFKLED